MAMGGLGAAAGPLIGGLITSALSWRAAFGFQALVIALIILLSLRISDPLPPDPRHSFDLGGAALSAVGLILVVMGILAASTNLWLTLGLMLGGAAVLAWFMLRVRAQERAGKEPLISSSLFRVHASNLGLITQNLQWLILMGGSFTVAAYLQVVRGYDAIQTGVIFTTATVGLLASSLRAEPLSRRWSQRGLIMAGFTVAVAGIGVLIGMVSGFPSPWAFAPGLLLIGVGVGLMLTPSVNLVQSAFPEERHGERSRSWTASSCRTRPYSSARSSTTRTFTDCSTASRRSGCASPRSANCRTDPAGPAPADPGSEQVQPGARRPASPRRLATSLRLMLFRCVFTVFTER
ncbi:MAG TPA: MFS transporter [Actinospica sp.]|nr:MFS transporter [Actinospica sp.]HWG23330.1 MFS transporter [Actinospica sp.]